MKSIMSEEWRGVKKRPGQLLPTRPLKIFREENLDIKMSLEG